MIIHPPARTCMYMYVHFFAARRGKSGKHRWPYTIAARHPTTLPSVGNAVHLGTASRPRRPTLKSGVSFIPTNTPRATQGRGKIAHANYWARIIRARLNKIANENSS
jgi:hypothetical protein